MQIGTKQVVTGTQLMEETQQKLNQVAIISTQMNTLVEELTQAATGQAKTSNSAIQSVLEVASIASQSSEQSLAVADSLAKLATAK